MSKDKKKQKKEKFNSINTLINKIKSRWIKNRKKLTKLKNFL